MAEQARRFDADVRRLLQRAPDFVTALCPACDGSTSRPAFEKRGFSYVSCADCDTIYMSPRPRPEHLRDYYETSENYRYWAEHIFPASESVRRDQIFRPRVKRILELCTRLGVQTDVLVEVGAGFGTFCEEMTRTGAFREVIAIEPTPDLARHCRDRGVAVIQKPVEAVHRDDLPAPSVIASFETIEHLYRPADLVQACAGLLPSGGMLVLTCPNGKGFEVGTLGAVSDTVDAEHLNYFNPRSLARFLAAHGFTPLEALTPGRLDAEMVRKKALAGEHDLDRSPFLRQVLVDEWERLGEPFQDFLAANGLSSHMWLVAVRDRKEAGPC
jgi:2-polyprenyl-3-methyl-5-hydroxy-6-metoxy-1,4-benzoquinol methylase